MRAIPSAPRQARDRRARACERAGGRRL